MKISLHKKIFALHDGNVESIEYTGDGGEISIAVALSGESNDEIGWFGKLIFRQFKVLQSEPPLETMDWDAIARTSIASSDYKPEHNQDGLEAMFWAIELVFQDRDLSEWLILEFLAESFDWEPDHSRPSPYL